MTGLTAKALKFVHYNATALDFFRSMTMQEHVDRAKFSSLVKESIDSPRISLDFRLAYSH